MRKGVVGVLIAFAFAAGCVTSRFAVPTARAGTDPTRWEYVCVDAWAGVTYSSNQLGKEGWEMVAAAGTADAMMWCFKRALP